MEYSWITGSVAWYTNTMESYMMGIRATYEGLCVDPHLPFARGTMKRSFRGATYNITIENPDVKYKDMTVSVVVDGKAIDGNVIPAFADGEHNVTVTIK
jgi:cellobiose phosphorylase